MDYGIIGNCKTAALVAQSGGIEWACLPVFDSPSAFARLLDPDGGHFAVEAKNPSRVTQAYLKNTNVLETVFDDGENAFAIIDFMPRYRDDGEYKRPVEIHRVLRPLKGRPVIKVSFKPHLNYAQDETSILVEKDAVVASNGLENLFLYSTLPLIDVAREEWIALASENFLLVAYHEKFEPPSLDYVLDMLERTAEYWRNWSAKCKLPASYPDAVLRSALTLKLLAHDATGAILAAATTSLPETIGGNRNWDYRFCWLRDASLMLEALKRIGHSEEAQGFIHFLLRLFESKRTRVQIMYGIDGRTNLEEFTLPHLKGYKDSLPVRVGNFAALTKQNDIFGEVLQTLYLYYVHYKFERMNDEVWSLVKFLTDTTVREWVTEDAGIWELRHIKGHFTFSKVLSWVALDRGIRIAEFFGKPHARERWLPIREAIRQDIETHGLNPDFNAFTQSYGSSQFDASLLLMEHYGFVNADDPRWIATVRHCDRTLVKNGFAFRYLNSDDFGEPKSAFVVASFWLTMALASIGDKARAAEIFENVLKRANHLGLLSEDIDPATGELLGNFPQAYSHMALINAAFSLSGGK